MAIEAFFDADGGKVADLSPAQEARALIESRFLSMRFHAEFIGLKMDRFVPRRCSAPRVPSTRWLARLPACPLAQPLRAP